MLSCYQPKSISLARPLWAAALLSVLTFVAPLAATTDSTRSLGGGYTFVGSGSGSEGEVFTGTFSGTLFGPGIDSSGIAISGSSTATGSNSFTATGDYSYQGTSGNFSCTVNTSTGTFSGSNCGIVGTVLAGGATANQSQNSAVTATQVNRSAAQQTAALIGRRIAASLTPQFQRSQRIGAVPDGSESTVPTAFYDRGIAGLAAGDGVLTKGLWATYGHSWLTSDLSGLESKGTINTGVVGADVKLNDTLLAGLTLTYQSTGLDTKYNDGTFDSGGFSFIPYGALALLDGHLVLDAMTGYGFGDNDVERNRSTLLKSKGSYHSDRWILSSNATYTWPIEHWTLSGKLGWLMSYEWAQSYTEDIGTRINGQVSRVGELSLGGKAAYSWDDVEPYVGLAYAYDPILGPSTVSATGQGLDRDEIQGLIGINWTPSERLTASIEGTRNFLREKQTTSTITGSLRLAF
ncbi:MAG: autotransporter domain-containing protein [Azospirillum sp.]|nr:autotransporter domain-containing protein [Azospirillum sp.]